MVFKIRDIDDTQSPLLDHLIELRKRLVRSFLALALAFGVCLYFSSDIFALLVPPLASALPPGQGHDDGPRDRREEHASQLKKVNGLELVSKWLISP